MLIYMLNLLQVHFRRFRNFFIFFGKKPPPGALPRCKMTIFFHCFLQLSCWQAWLGVKKKKVLDTKISNMSVLNVFYSEKKDGVVYLGISVRTSKNQFGGVFFCALNGKNPSVERTDLRRERHIYIYIYIPK